MPDQAPIDCGNYPPTARQLNAIGALQRRLATLGRPHPMLHPPASRREASSMIRTMRHMQRRLEQHTAREGLQNTSW